MLLKMKRNDLMMEFALFVERNLNISIMTHRAVEDIAAHPQSIDITLGFHINSLIKILARKIANYEQRRTNNC